jgi:hypothetical protein
MHACDVRIFVRSVRMGTISGPEIKDSDTSIQ